MKITEFRGCRGLVFAEILADDNTEGSGYKTGDVKPLAGSAEISKTVETSSESKFYDNKAALIIDSEGDDVVTFTISVPDDETLAAITGRTYDKEKKAFIDTPRKTKYFAVGYIIGEKSDKSDERYVWRLKGKFNIPDETAATENNGTDANNMQLEFRGIYTQHVFESLVDEETGEKLPAKSWYKRKSDGNVTEEQFFANVATPDSTFA